ncbi:MAG: hypothetical protein ABI549_10345, partial [Flavobacterium sp.]|uniref:hypothetical protein n=1 Tax=Flavobacterium sp. TaxID=239 RepID=UPI0032667662
MKTIKQTLVILTIILFAISCNKNDDEPQQISASEPTLKDVYSAGLELNASGKYAAKYWKNNVVTNLTDGTQNATAYSVVVIGTDVYVAGYEENGTKKVAKYWKNGVSISLSDGTQDATAKAITVVGNEVYVAGFEKNALGVQVAKYWKNGISNDLTDGTQNASTN